MTDYFLALPPGSYGLVDALQNHLRTGIDGAEIIHLIFGGDRFAGETLEGKWHKWKDSQIASYFKAIQTGGNLQLTGQSDGAGTWRYGGVNCSSPIALKPKTYFDIHVQLPGHSAANNFRVYWVFTDIYQGEANPLTAAPNYLWGYLDTDTTTYRISVVGNHSGSAQTFLAASTRTNLQGTFRVKWTSNSEVHIYYHDGSGAVVETTDEVTGSPFDLSDYNFSNGFVYPCFMVGSSEAASRMVLSNHWIMTYPFDSTFMLQPKYEISAANRLLGSCKMFDTMGSAVETDWKRVYDPDHVFVGNCVVQNGLIRLVVTQATNNGLVLYYWTGAAWATPISFFVLYTANLAKDLRYSFLSQIISVTFEKISVKVRLEDSAVQNGDYYIDVVLTIQRGQYGIQFGFVKMYPTDWFLFGPLFNTNQRWGYAGNAQASGIADYVLSLIGDNSTMGDDYLVGFDHSGPTILVTMSCDYKPAWTFNAPGNVAGNPLRLNCVQAILLGKVHIYVSIVPFAKVAKLFIEAESATLGGGADTASGGAPESGGLSARLDAQNETVDYNVVAGTDLPAGRYLALWRIRDTNHVASDVFLTVYCTTAGEYRSEFNGNEYVTATASWVYYARVFDILAADVTGTKNIQIRAKKATATANVIYVDYFLLIFLGNGQTGPQDLAHQALRSIVADRRVFLR